MATFLELTNLVLSKLNDVPLTEGNFTAARGVQANVKEGVNQAVRDITTSEQEWPFLYSLHTETLVPGQTLYALAPNTRKIDWDTIRLVRNPALEVEAKFLRQIQYEDWVRARRERDENTTSAEWQVPDYSFRNIDNKIGVTPKPDKAYQIQYDRWTVPVDMSGPLDVCVIPDDYKNVVVDGATWHAYAFRSNDSFTDRQERRFREGIAKMRQVLINRNDYVTGPYTYAGGHPGRYRLELTW